MWLEPDEDVKQNNPGNPNSLSIGAGGGSAANPTPGITGNPSTINPIQSNAPKQDFATVQDYLGANKPQGEDLGQKFTTSLSQSQTGEKQAIDAAANQTKNDIATGSTSFDSGLVNKAVADPTSVVNNSGDLNSFLKQWNAAYTGPSSFENSTNYAPATAAANDATTKQTELGTVGGQQQLLQDQFGVYGQGNKGLDQAILQNSSYFPQVQDQGKQFGTVQDYLGQQASDVDAAATKAATDTAATQKQTQDAFANSLTNFQGDINSKVAANQAAATTQANKYQADFASGDPTKIVADLKEANPNIDATTIQQYLTAYAKDFGKPSDLSQFYSYNPATAITAANTATQADYDKAAALQQLTGKDFSGVLSPTNVAEAGTAPSATSGINSVPIADYLRGQYTDAELAKLGASPSANGSFTTPNLSNPSSLTPSSSKPTDVAGNILGGAAGSGLGNVVNGVTGNIIGTIGGSLLGGQSGLSDSINKALGIGGGKKDATVNLPPMNLPPLKAPVNGDPDTNKLITDIFNTPLSTGGSYHEGAVADIVGRLDKLKAAESQGKITPDEYKSYAQPLEDWATKASYSIMSASSQAATSNTPAYNKLQQYLK